MPTKTTRKRSLEDACDKAILDTLSYKAVFKLPMSYFQLGTYLISESVFSNEIFNASLGRLKKSKKIKIDKNRYFLPGVKALSWERRFKYSEEHLLNSREIFKILGFIPWIQFLGVTGSVAAYNSTFEDDVDTFIITRKNRLWLTRFFVYVFLTVLKKYPGGNKNAGKICPNIYITEDNMTWEKEKQNLFVATDILLMQPIIVRNDMYFRFMKANTWITQFYANPNFVLPKKFKRLKDNKSFIVDSLEQVFMKVQMSYMKPKLTTEIVKNKIIHFNKNDSTQKILTKYNRILAKK